MESRGRDQLDVEVSAIILSEAKHRVGRMHRATDEPHPRQESPVTMTAPARPAMPPSDHTPRPYTGPSKQEVLAMRRQYCHPSTFLYYREPLMVVEGYMQYLYDETGRRYLDMFAGIVTVSCGHSHPKFVERLKAQIDAIQHTTTIYLHPNFPLMARRLAEKMPPGLDVTYFVNSGSEANDLAVADGPRLHGAQRRHRRAERLPRRLALDDGADLAPHLEVPPAAEPRRPPRDQSRPLPEPVHGHAGGDRPEERRGHPRPRSATPRRAGSPRSSPSRSRASAG